MRKSSKEGGCATPILVVLGLIVFLLYLTGRNATEHQPAIVGTSGTAPTASPSSAPIPPKPEPGAQWIYRHETDSMGKGSIHEAEVSSTNAVNFSFPYAGEQHGSLTLRTHPRFGQNIIFAIRKGQILCRSYENCEVLVRFDDEQASNYAGRGPSDNSTETVFILGYDRFIGKMLKAKQVRIAPGIYQQGSPVFEFDVSGFDQKKYRPAK